MLSKKTPREQSGRDTLARFRSQTRSAAVASLEILEGKDVDRVYCDLHDDFVVRKKSGQGFIYIFYQVKTKSPVNYQWRILDVLGIKTRGKQTTENVVKAIKSSFVGKLLLHTVVFNGACDCVVFQTNIHNKQDLQELIDDIASGEYANKYSQLLLSNFNDCFKDELKKSLTNSEIKDNLSKLNFDTDVQYLKLKNDNFFSHAKDSIFKYSEVELGHLEAEEILIKLLYLVNERSSGVLTELAPASIDKEASISIEDLLSVLSLSKEAYDILVSSGDEKAIKSVSIIQRSLKNASADIEEIKFCSTCKSKWDNWVRNSRHTIQDIPLFSIKGRLSEVFKEHISNYRSINILQLQPLVENLLTELEEKNLKYDLDHEILMGGIFAELVKVKSL